MNNPILYDINQFLYEQSYFIWY